MILIAKTVSPFRGRTVHRRHDWPEGRVAVCHSNPAGFKRPALDYAASLIHSAMTDASSPFRFAPDALQVALLEGNTEVGGLKDSVILTMKGSRLIEGEIDLGFDLSGFDISNLDALKSLLGLSQPDLLSITALDGSLLRYAVSVDLDVAVELDANATVKFVKQDLSNGNYVDLADETVAPLRSVLWLIWSDRYFVRD